MLVNLNFPQALNKFSRGNFGPRISGWEETLFSNILLNLRQGWVAFLDESLDLKIPNTL